jgi:hypothetical protein
MKKLFFITLLIIGNIVFSQNGIGEQYSKIKFVYEQKSNFFFEDDKVYADTLLIAYLFPKLEFSKIISPLDSKKIIGFLAINDLNKEDKKRLGSSLYHLTHTIEGSYDLKKNKTKLFFTRGNKTMYEILKKHIGGSGYSKFTFNVIIDYGAKKIHTNYPRTNYTESFGSRVKHINFANNDKVLGTYTFQTENGTRTDVVTLNKNYKNKIAPNIIFSNNDFGVDQIVSLFDTIKLISVSYQ